MLRRCPHALHGAAYSTWATTAAATVDASEATPRREERAMGCVAWSRATDHRLASSYAARTSTATHGGTAVVAGAVHRPFWR
jgi:hypothetical protein